MLSEKNYTVEDIPPAPTESPWASYDQNKTVYTMTVTATDEYGAWIYNVPSPYGEGIYYLNRGEKAIRLTEDIITDSEGYDYFFVESYDGVRGYMLAKFCTTNEYDPTTYGQLTYKDYKTEINWNQDDAMMRPHSFIMEVYDNARLYSEPSYESMYIDIVSPGFSGNSYDDQETSGGMWYLICTDRGVWGYLNGAYADVIPE
jgi:hypothetical protein